MCLERIGDLLEVTMDLGGRTAVPAPEGRKKIHTAMRISPPRRLDSGEEVISPLIIVNGGHRRFHIIFIGKGSSSVKDVVKVRIGKGRTVGENGATLAILKLQLKLRDLNLSKCRRRIANLLL